MNESKKVLVIKPQNVNCVMDKRFIRLYDMEYVPGRHYFNASRRAKEDLVAVKSAESARTMLPDAVSCFVVLDQTKPGEEPLLLLSQEYRYPAGRFLLSVPAGLIDRADQNEESPLITAAKREVMEETGLIIKPEDQVRVIAPFLYSTPGMTDESNALIGIVIKDADLSCLDQSGAEGSELFDGFDVINRAEAKRILKAGRDRDGKFYSVFTWAALTWFVSGMWQE